MSPTSYRVEQLLTEQHPVIHRMALALSGRPDVARAVVRHMLKVGLERTAGSKQSPPARWFEHHTVLTARRALRHQPEPKSDALVLASPLQTPGYTAFVRAVRALPFQQREAFILTHGAGFDLRRLAVAMDCSTEAAGNHLRGADVAIGAIAEQSLDAFIGAMRKAYGALLPSEDVYLPAVRRSIRQRIQRRRILRGIGWLIVLGLFALAGYALWALLPLLDY